MAEVKSPIRLAILAAILLSTIVLSATSYYWPIQDPYHPYNDAWNGCSNLLNLVHNPDFLYSSSNPIPPDVSLLAIIGPTVVFTQSDGSRIQNFLKSGGVVLLADDFGTGNSLLENLNVSARFSDKAISDLYFYSKQIFFPLISQFTSNPVTNNLTTIVMSHPSFLEIQDPGSVKELAYSSPFSFVDFYGNGTVASNETTQSYPVIASTQVGGGKLVLVSNAETFANDMINLYNNTRLFMNIVNLTTGTIAFDLTHLRTAPLTDQRFAFRTEVNVIAQALQSTVLRVILTTALILGFSIMFLRRMRSYRPFANGTHRGRNQAYISRPQTHRGGL